MQSPSSKSLTIWPITTLSVCEQNRIKDSSNRRTKPATWVLAPCHWILHRGDRCPNLNPGPGHANTPTADAAAAAAARAVALTRDASGGGYFKSSE